MIDECFEALANRYRRRLLVALLAHNPQADDDLQYPDNVTVADSDAAVLSIKMVHLHLPKLVEMGFIDWDQETNTIATGPEFEEIRPLVEVLDEQQDELPDEWP